MSEKSMNTVEHTDEVEQISLLSSCTTKLHRYNRVTLLIFIKKNFLKIQPTPPFYYPPLITFMRVSGDITGL